LDNLTYKKKHFIIFQQELQMIESCLIFIVSLLSIRTNLGLDEEALSRLEMVSLLCMADKTHSVLHEHMPEKPGTPVQLELFDR
jgi:E3 ubiquitin-protein ligase UBR3